MAAVKAAKLAKDAKAAEVEAAAKAKTAEKKRQGFIDRRKNCHFSPNQLNF